MQCLVSRYGGDVGDAGEGMDNDFTSESCVNGINDGENHGEDYLNDDGADLDSKSANQFSLEKERQYKVRHTHKGLLLSLYSRYTVSLTCSIVRPGR